MPVGDLRLLGGRERGGQCQGYGQGAGKENGDDRELAELMGINVEHFGCVLASRMRMGRGNVA